MVFSLEKSSVFSCFTVFLSTISSNSSLGLAITCLERKKFSPNLHTSAAPASTAAFTAPTSPSTIIVVIPPVTFSFFISLTSAAFNIESAASIDAIKPFVSISPIACI